MTEEKKIEIREQVGVVLLAGVLVMSGLLLIKDKDAPAKFSEGTTSISSSSDGEKSVADSSQQVSNDKTSALVNINSASIEDLDTLPGIGEKTAQKIIDYRVANGSFKSKEELMEVSGIGEAKYAAVKDMISI